MELFSPSADPGGVARLLTMGATGEDGLVDLSVPFLGTEPPPPLCKNGTQ